MIELNMSAPHSHELGVVGIAQGVAQGVGAAVFVEVDFARTWKAAKTVGLLLKFQSQIRAHGKTLVGQFIAVVEEFTLAKAPETPMEIIHGCDGTGYSHGQAAGEDVVEWLTVFIQEHVGTRCRRQLFAAVDGRNLPRCRFIVEDEASAAGSAALGLHQREHGLYGKRGVGGRSPTSQDACAGVAGQGMSAGHAEVWGAENLALHRHDFGEDERVGKFCGQGRFGGPERSQGEEGGEKGHEGSKN